MSAALLAPNASDGTLNALTAAMLSREHLRQQRWLVTMRIFAAIVTLAAALSVWSCRPDPTAEDSRRLEQLQQRYGDRYRFELEEDTYIEATNKVDATVSTNEAISIYKDFWFNGNIERRDSHYVYLNLYNKDGDFQFQIFWDRNSGRFITSNRGHY